MEFQKCRVTDVNVNIAGGRLNIAFSLELNEENMENATKLSLYVPGSSFRDPGEVEVRVIQQQPLPPLTTRLARPTLHVVKPTRRVVKDEEQ